MAKIGKRTSNRIIKRLKEIIDVHTYLRMDDSGHYYGEIYADYRDEFDESTIIDIFKADNPRDNFYERLDFIDCEYDYKDEVIKEIKEHFNDEDKTLDFDKYEDFIRDWVYENVYYNYPYDHYLDQDVYIDIIVDTGDANYDYTQNELFGCNYSERGLDGRDNSGLVWLMQQQGYEMGAITDFVLNENFQNSKLLESTYQECINTTTCMNALAFFVKLSLRGALDLYEIINNPGSNKSNGEAIESADPKPTGIIIGKDTPCGLYDAWNGAGSLLGIHVNLT